MQVSHHHCCTTSFLEDQASSDQPVCNAAQPVKISPSVDVRIAQRQFRRHIRGRPRRCAWDSHLCFILVLQYLDQAEIEDLCKVIFVSQATKEYIRRLDVAMNHALTISLCKRPAYLAQDRYNSRRRLRAKLLYQRVQINAVQQFHHVIKRALFGDTEVV